MRYKLMIFDFDGTLADTMPWFVSVINDVAKKFNFRPVQTHEHDTLRNFPGREFLRHLEVPRWKIPLIAAYMHTLMQKDIESIRLFPGVDDMLALLHQADVILAAVSSNSLENVRLVLGSDNAARFHWYECGVALFGKATKLKHVLRKAGVSPAEAIYIGDEIEDVIAAHKINMAAGAVSWGFNSLESLQQNRPDEIFHSLDDIVRLATRSL